MNCVNNPKIGTEYLLSMISWEFFAPSEQTTIIGKLDSLISTVFARRITMEIFTITSLHFASFWFSNDYLFDQNEYTPEFE